MHISDLLNIQQIIPELKVSSKKQALNELACFAGAQLGIDQQVILDLLLEREKLGSTGVGHRIAIPHAKIPNLDQIHIILARLKNPVDFQSSDKLTVDLLVMILSPENAGGEYLTTLASIARLLHNERVVAQIRGSETAEGIYTTIYEAENA